MGKLTEAEATTFETYSQKHELILAMAAGARGCACEAYRDWYTYNRWNAQGYQVQKGEKGVCLQTYRPIEEKDEKTGKVKRSVRPWRSYVFCRCQVAERERGKS